MADAFTSTKSMIDTLLGVSNTQEYFDKIIHVTLLKSVTNTQPVAVMSIDTTKTQNATSASRFISSVTSAAAQIAAAASGTVGLSKNNLTDEQIAYIEEQEATRGTAAKNITRFGIYSGKSHTEYTVENDLDSENGFGEIKSSIVAPTETISISSDGTDIYEMSQRSYSRFWTRPAFRKQLKNITENSSFLIQYTNEQGAVEYFHMSPLTENLAYRDDYFITEAITIKCPDYGIKPTIAVTVNEIPGSSCYKLILKIYNLDLPVDIRTIKQLRVTMGYRTHSTLKTYDCPVFTSYIESPNPDGVTVFECLCVGNTHVFSVNGPIIIRYLGGKITIAEFISKIAAVLGLTDENCLLNETSDSKGFNSLQMSLNKMETYAESGQSLIQWAQEIIQQRIAVSLGFVAGARNGAEAEYPVVCMRVFNGKLVTFCINAPNNDVKTDWTKIPVLDSVKGAVFSGPVLTLNTLWIPEIYPGSIFKCDISIFNGAGTPNNITLSALGIGASVGSTQGLYRVITMSVVFSTNGSDNEMQLLAVPLHYMMDQATEEQQTRITFDQYLTDAMDLYVNEKAKICELGTADVDAEEVSTVTESEEVSEETVEETTTETLETTELTDEQKTQKEAQVTSEYVDKINTLFSLTLPSDISYGTLTMTRLDSIPQMCGKLYNWNTLLHVYTLSTGEYCWQLTEPENGISPYYVMRRQLNAVPDCFWVLVSLKTHELSKSDSNYADLDILKNPGSTYPGKKLAFPIFTSLTQLKACRKIFATARDLYDIVTFPLFAPWQKSWNNLITFLNLGESAADE